MVDIGDYFEDVDWIGDGWGVGIDVIGVYVDLVFIWGG